MCILAVSYTPNKAVRTVGSTKTVALAGSPDPEVRARQSVCVSRGLRARTGAWGGDGGCFSGVVAAASRASMCVAVSNCRAAGRTTHS